MREWNRAELKQKAKAGLRRYYLAAILVSFVLGILGIGMAASGVGEEEKNDFLSAIGIEQAAPEADAAAEDAETAEIVEEIFGDWTPEQLLYLAIAFLAAMAAAGVIGFIIRILALNVIEVGSRRFYLEGQSGGQPGVGMLLWGFKSGAYGNIVKVMLIRDIKLFLWTLLLIIPGVVKSYEYRMIPYLLSADPHMSSEAAFAGSREMMNGNKWKTFVLDLSFLGWNILAGIAGLILGIVPILGDTLAKLPQLCLTPYIDATETELYMTLSGNAAELR